MLSFANAAYRDLQDRTAGVGVTVNRAVAILSACPGATVALTLGSTPPLPADFVLPYTMQERTASSSDLFADMDESETIPLPDTTAGATRGIWAYYQNQINLTTSTQAQDFRLSYEQRLSPFTLATDAVAIIGSVNVLSYKTAAYAAFSRGDNKNGARLEADYQMAVKRYLGTHVQGQQFKAGRRVPFGFTRSKIR